MTGANPADSESPEAGEADRWRGVCVCWKLHSREGGERDRFWELLVVWNYKTKG